MPHYYFHLRQNDGVFKDTRGGEFDDLEAAWNWALSDVRAIVKEGQLDGPIDQHWLEISDPTGRTVAILPFERALRLQ